MNDCRLLGILDNLNMKQYRFAAEMITEHLIQVKFMFTYNLSCGRIPQEKEKFPHIFVSVKCIHALQEIDTRTTKYT